MVDNDVRYIKFILKHLSYFKLILQRSKNTATKQSQTYAPLLSRKFKNGVENLRWQTMTHLPYKLCNIHLHITDITTYTIKPAVSNVDVH